MDMSQYRELYVSEANSYLEQISELILRLEHAPDDQEAIAALFRSTHSLKGMSSTMDFESLTTLAHRMEDLMDRVRAATVAVDGGIADLLLAGTDAMSEMVADVAAGRSPERDIAELAEKLAAYGQNQQVSEVEEKTPAVLHGPRESETPFLSSAVSSSVRVRTQTLDRLIDMSGELLTVRHRFAALAEKIATPELSETVQQLSVLLRKLHSEVITVRMLPLSTVTDRFPRMLRDLARRSGKEIDFTVAGQGMELDRSIVDQLVEPLVHLLRNAVDHGLESGAERLASGKSPVGHVSLSIKRDQDHAVISVEDDGRGIDPQQLLAAAIAKGIIAEADGKKLSPKEVLMLICQPGFSTVREVTDISGRGVGMDAVRTMVQTMGGSLVIESKVGKGSRMLLRVPMSVAIVAVLLVAAGPYQLAVPAHSVVSMLELRRDQVRLRDKRPYALVGDKEFPLYSLNRIFGVPLPKEPAATLPLFVVDVRERRLGFVVERFLGQQEIFVKPLGRPLAALPGIAGSAVLGDGTVVYVLDVPRLR